MRRIRWWAQTEGAHFSQRRQVHALQRWYPLSASALQQVLTRETYADVSGLPQAALWWRWTPRHRQEFGLLLWLAWLLWMLRAPSNDFYRGTAQPVPTTTKDVR